ncbi:hypothetical protein IMSHALPRED_002978 [Imshaugia aleurites]|uniref:Uncharacterized protein n=1 Tax=Imshaugia aleurites TaxID=172621 RepID=A0A8H3F5N8_9LECA|nr:hypothetical protein IMSHALPRED_002978 [Imshaugia aleurites]
MQTQLDSKKSKVEPAGEKVVATKTTSQAAALAQTLPVTEESKVEPAAGIVVPSKILSPPAGPSGMLSIVLNLSNHALIHFEASPRKQKLQPVCGEIVVVDAAGKRFFLGWRKLKVEMDGPVSSGACKVTGFAEVTPG